jgi:hypothetical protein
MTETESDTAGCVQMLKHLTEVLSHEAFICDSCHGVCLQLDDTFVFCLVQDHCPHLLCTKQGCDQIYRCGCGLPYCHQHGSSASVHRSCLECEKTFCCASCVEQPLEERYNCCPQCHRFWCVHCRPTGDGCMKNGVIQCNTPLPVCEDCATLESSTTTTTNTSSASAASSAMTTNRTPLIPPETSAVLSANHNE